MQNFSIMLPYKPRLCGLISQTLHHQGNFLSSLAMRNSFYFQLCLKDSHDNIRLLYISSLCQDGIIHSYDARSATCRRCFPVSRIFIKQKMYCTINVTFSQHQPFQKNSSRLVMQSNASAYSGLAASQPSFSFRF